MKLDKATALGELKDGVWILNNAPLFKVNLAKYEDCKIRCIVERVKNSRSQRQNNWYWHVLTIISRDQGNTPEELHDIFSSLFLKTKRVWRAGNVTTLKSTTQLTKGEFVEYMENIRAEVAELGIEIPDPDQLYDLY